MADKLALVVDDSKSARLVLKRMLEKHGLAVDTVNSAAEALDYLNRLRPDVIFLDHMMPGMDGFEALRRIKADPSTAAVPVMMYTSKGGDLYLGQARALGAVGILPKTVAPAELYESLLRLGLIRDRRRAARALEEDGASERAADIATAAASAPLPVRRQDDTLDSERMRGLLEEQSVELRKDLLLGIDSVGQQFHQRIERELDEKLAPLKSESSPAALSPALPLIIVAVLLFVSLAWNYILLQQPPATALTGQAAPAKAQPAATEVRAAPSPARTNTPAAVWALAEWGINQNTDYPFDELALDKRRLTQVRELIELARAAGFQGRIVLETHVGEFCLSGNPTDGFRLAPPALPVSDCDFIGNPVQPTDLPSAHQSLQFANFLASAPLRDSGIEVEVSSQTQDAPLFDYPPRETTTHAGEWNRAAQLNNRVVVRLEPGSLK